MTIGSNPSERLTIQLYLDGYSFVVCDAMDRVLHLNSEKFSLLEEAFAVHPMCGRDFESVDVYVDTPAYTLVPDSFFREEIASSLLGAQIEFDKDRCLVSYLEVPSQKAVLVYAIDRNVASVVRRSFPTASVRPQAAYLLERVGRISDYNRLFVHLGSGQIHIAAAQSEKLLLLNTYQCRDEVNSLSYVTAVCREVMFNPVYTTLYLSGKVDPELDELLCRYFSITHMGSLV
mgnify:CR=1 FL=1